MGTYETDINNFMLKIDPYDKPIFVASDIKNYSSILENAGITQCGFTVRRCIPVRFSGNCNPGKQMSHRKPRAFL